MTEEEIKKFINLCLDKKLNDFRSGYLNRMQHYEADIIKKINNETEISLDFYKNINNRLLQIDNSIRAGQIGLQNVYDIFQKLTDGNFISNFESHKLDMMNKVEYMRKHLWDIEKWLKKCEKKMAAINNLYSLRNQNEEIIYKLAKICKAINNEGDE